MNALTIALFSCLVIVASAVPSGILGHVAGVVPAGPTTLIGASGVVGPNGAAGPTGVVTGNGAVGPTGLTNAIGARVVAAGGLVAPAVVARLDGWDGDDGQWHGEGLLASQDLEGRAAVIARGIIGAHGLGIARAHW